MVGERRVAQWFEVTYAVAGTSVWNRSFQLLSYLLTVIMIYLQRSVPTSWILEEERKKSALTSPDLLFKNIDVGRLPNPKFRPNPRSGSGEKNEAIKDKSEYHISIVCILTSIISSG